MKSIKVKEKHKQALLNHLEVNKTRQKLLTARTYQGYNEFAEAVLKDKNNNSFKQGEIHRFWNWFIDTCLENDQKKILILAPMEHGKTSQISIGRTLHFIGLNPNVRIKLISVSDPLAMDKANAVRRLIDGSEDYHNIFPNVVPATTDGDTWSNHKLVVKRDSIGMIDGTLESKGVGAKGIGGRADILLFDDVVDMDNASSELQRKNIRNRCNLTWVSRIEDDDFNKYNGIILYVGTAYHEDDVAHYWINNEDSGFCSLVMGVTDDFKEIEWTIRNGDHIFKKASFKGGFEGLTEGTIPLWELKNETILRGKYIGDKEGEGKRWFARAYQNKFVSSEERIFECIHNCKNDKIHIDDVRKQTTWPSFMGLDLAISKRSGSAYTVFTIGKKDLEGKKYLCEVIRERFSSTATAVIALGLGAKYLLEIGLIENNAYQQSVLEWIESFKDDCKVQSLLESGKEDLQKYYQKLEKKLEYKYSSILSKDISPKLWAYIKDDLLLCGRSILNFQPYTTGKSITDETVGLPSLAVEFESNQWVIPWMDHPFPCACDMCIAIKELDLYPGVKYKDCVMSWFFLSRAMKMGVPRVRTL